MKLLKALTYLLFITFPSTYTFGQSECEKAITASIETLSPLFHKNDYPAILKNIRTIESVCGSTEFSLRTQIIYSIINKENTNALVVKYLKSGFADVLINRWDDAYREDYKEMYKENRKRYEFIPLRHAVDSLLKVKASAILNSSSYSTINKNEETLLYLFKDDVDTYLEIKDQQITDREQKKWETYAEEKKDKHTFGVHSGIFMPLGENEYFNNSFTGGISYMSPFANKFILDIHYKLRVHPKSNVFDFEYKDEIREVDAITSHVIALGMGYKLLDKNRFIILPKLNLGYGIIWTGLSETVYGEDDEGNTTETMLFRNVQTLHSSLGISVMHHLFNKTYIGIETNLHLVPYQWDSRLKSPIPSKYTSFEFFVRF